MTRQWFVHYIAAIVRVSLALTQPRVAPRADEGKLEAV